MTTVGCGCGSGSFFGPPGSLLFIDILFTWDRQKQTQNSRDKTRATGRLRGKSQRQIHFLIWPLAKTLCYKNATLVSVTLKREKKRSHMLSFFLSLLSVFNLLFLSPGCCLLLPVNTFSISDTALLSVSRLYDVYV